ncbi:MAG: hypothetical protein FWD87_06855 [Spirochaetaceae bacterium]|nr:hypothetical protein [Spirochaetaceae bacterium]
MKTKIIISFILILGIMLLSACFIPNSEDNSYFEDMGSGTRTATIRLPAGSTVFATINGFNYAHGTGGTNVVLGSNNNVPINMQRYADYKYI